MVSRELIKKAQGAVTDWEYVAHAVATHDALLQAAKDMLMAMAPRFSRTGCSTSEESASKRLRAAIAKAEARP